MILTLVVILLLVSALGRGFHRGFVVELVNTVGYLFILLLARLLTPTVATGVQHLLPANHQVTANDQLLNSQVNHFWAAGIAFWGLMIIGIILLRLLTRSLKLFTNLPVIHGVNALAGAAVAGILMYILIFFGLAIASVWPATWIHDQLLHSPLSMWILHQTPLLSEQIYQWWLTR
ncbi:CvpA family protein [Furfurilactobacillus sp. WILCCON 0119]|uniref:CvpA family protein n=1 Tax=Furfurilactobacillus entadae TaxID=2922307 RepID=UPI0035E8521C